MSSSKNRFHPGAAPSRAEDVVPRNIAGETILVPVRGELAEMQEIFVLDEVAEVIWGMLDGRHTVDAICAAVVEQFEVEARTARTDLETFLSELAEVGLVTVAEPTADPAP